MVESSSDAILEGAITTDVAFLVVGDPFGYVALGGKVVEDKEADHITEQRHIPILCSELVSFRSLLRRYQMPQSCLPLARRVFNSTTSVRP